MVAPESCPIMSFQSTAVEENIKIIYTTNLTKLIKVTVYFDFVSTLTR